MLETCKSFMPFFKIIFKTCLKINVSCTISVDLSRIVQLALLAIPF
jgi:hypothetical protein